MSVFKELKTFFKIIKHLSEIKKQYTHVIVHTHSTKAGLLGRWAAFFARIPSRIHTVHGFGFNHFQPRIIWATIYLLELITSLITTKYICVSQTDVNTGTKLFPRFNAQLIRAAVSDNYFISAHKTHFNQKIISPFIFGTVACFKKQKNLFDLLYAFELVHQKHAHARLELIGDGILRPQIESWIQTHNLTHTITLHGWQHDIVPIMHSWQAFVLTSLWEGLPCAVVEARLLKLPVISYKTGGIPEVIHYHINGFLCEQKDWLSCTLAMQKIIENHALRTKLSTHSDDFTYFRETTMIAQHIKLYQNTTPPSV